MEQLCALFLLRMVYNRNLVLLRQPCPWSPCAPCCSTRSSAYAPGSSRLTGVFFIFSLSHKKQNVDRWQNWLWNHITGTVWQRWRVLLLAVVADATPLGPYGSRINVNRSCCPVEWSSLPNPLLGTRSGICAPCSRTPFQDRPAFHSIPRRPPVAPPLLRCP